MVTFFDNLLGFPASVRSFALKPSTTTLVVGVSLTAFFATRDLMADVPTLSVNAAIATASLGQSSANNADRKKESDDLLRRSSRDEGPESGGGGSSDCESGKAERSDGQHFRKICRHSG